MLQFIVKTGCENMDTDTVISLLQSTYWADDRDSEVIIKSMQNSLCFGVFEKQSGNQVAFARVITDYATTYYLCDVIVSPQHQHQKIGSLLLENIVNNDILKNLRAILATKDAHSFYQHFGFEKNDKLFMQRWTKVL